MGYVLLELIPFSEGRTSSSPMIANIATRSLISFPVPFVYQFINLYLAYKTWELTASVIKGQPLILLALNSELPIIIIVCSFFLPLLKIKAGFPFSLSYLPI